VIVQLCACGAARELGTADGRENSVGQLERSLNDKR
jgi:hypothetical protein